MADYPIYRLVKGTQLTFTEMDDNLRWLSQNMSGSQVTITGSTIGITGSMIIDGDVFIAGTASIGFLKTIAFSSGSNQLGNDTLDTQTLVGTVNISGSLNVTGSAVINDLTGSLFGTSSWAQNAVTASYVLNAVSASYVSGSAAFVTNLTSSNDASINGLTIGKGNNNVTNNVVLGKGSLSSITSGNYNTAIGTSVMPSLTSANSNTALGWNAGLNLSIGAGNTLLGSQAGQSLSTGDSNTLVGIAAGWFITGGSFNVIVGRNAGASIASGYYNTILGSNITGLPATLNNNIILADGEGNIKYRWDATQNNIYGNLAVTGSITATQNITASNALITGTITAQTLVVQTITSSVIYSSGSNRFGNDLTNQQTFTGSVSITGSLSLRNLTGGNYVNVLVVDTGSGKFYYTASSGLSVPGVFASDANSNIYSLDPASKVPGINFTNNVFIGDNAASGSTGYTRNSFVAGFEAAGGPQNSTLENVTLVGYRAGYNAEYSDNSVIVGYEAGALDGDGGPEINDSNFLGYQAGYSSSFAYESNFLGNSAGYSSSNASDSNFLGYHAGYAAINASYSNFFGQSAGAYAENAISSNFLGNGAGSEAINAGYSNFFGQSAGNRAYSASYSTLIGYRAGVNDPVATGIGSNNIIIGTNISLPDGTQDSINLGGVIFATGAYSDPNTLPSILASTIARVGINKVSPNYTLDVSGSGNFSNELRVTGSLIAPSITGSLFGTSSWAISASFARSSSLSVSASYAFTASSAISASYAFTASSAISSSRSNLSATASNFAGTGSDGFVSNMSDNYTGTAKITNVVTLSAAEYAAIVSPLTNTLYIII